MADALVDGRLAMSDQLAAIIPQPAASVPQPEKTGGAAGSTLNQFALPDHQHPRLTSVVTGAIAAGNTATILFTRSFASEPGIDYQELPPSANTTAPDAADMAPNAQPSACKVIAWTKGSTTALPQAAAGEFTGCTVRVWRSQTIPQNLVNLLLGGIFNIFATSVVGTRFSLIAVARSDVP